MRLLNSKSLVAKSPVTKSLVRTGIIVASLALAGNAFAANDTHVAVNALRTAHVTQTGVAAAKYHSAAQRQFDPADYSGPFVWFAVPVGTPRDSGDGST